MHESRHMLPSLGIVFSVRSANYTRIWHIYIFTVAASRNPERNRKCYLVEAHSGETHCFSPTVCAVYFATLKADAYGPA